MLTYVVKKKKNTDCVRVILFYIRILTFYAKVIMGALEEYASDSIIPNT